MIIKIDDDFGDEIVRASLADTYVSISGMMKSGKSWHEDDVASWKELLPALKKVGSWYSIDFDADIKKARKKK